jgi:hypothetical protein
MLTVELKVDCKPVIAFVNPITRSSTDHESCLFSEPDSESPVVGTTEPRLRGLFSIQVPEL